MRRIVIATVIALTAIGALPNASAQSNTFTVDCNRGQKIATALELGDYRRPVLINVRGTCREFVVITRAGVTLRGDPTAEIVAPDNAHDLLTVSADRAWLGSLTLTGGLTGLSQDHEPSFYAEKLVVQDTRGVGVRIRVGDARINDCTVQRAGGAGVSVIRGGSAILSNCQVLDSGEVGISVTGTSVVNLTNGSKVMRSGAEGVVLGDGSQGTIRASTISDNGAVGLHVGTGSSVSVFDSTISGNGRSARPQGDGIMVWGGAQAHVQGANVVTDNRDAGINVAGGAGAFVTGAKIARNGGDGIFGYMGANLVLGTLQIEDNRAVGVSCSGKCAAQMDNVSIHRNAWGGVYLAYDSSLFLVGPPIDLADNGSWGLNCQDAESRVLNIGMVTGTIGPKCTEFD